MYRYLTLPPHGRACRTAWLGMRVSLATNQLGYRGFPPLGIVGICPVDYRSTLKALVCATPVCLLKFLFRIYANGSTLNTPHKRLSLHHFSQVLKPKLRGGAVALGATVNHIHGRPNRSLLDFCWCHTTVIHRSFSGMRCMISSANAFHATLTWHHYRCMEPWLYWSIATGA